jgi:phosphoribosylformimino-5-aminoimidazole carboxamide ribotide isomerase
VYLLPLLEVKNGETVHVLQWPGQGEQRPLMDPLEVVNRLAGLGAQGFHIVDVDHAVDPNRDNDAHLVRVLDHTRLPVVAGGGVRSLKRIQELLDTGVARVLVGSMGILHPDWLKEAAYIFRERLVACLDVRGEEVLVKGRTEVHAQSLAPTLERLDAIGLESLHVAYIGPNGGGPELMERIAPTLRTPLTYQGAVAGPGDLERLERAGVRGAILGAEIYDGRLRFDALAKQYRVR